MELPSADEVTYGWLRERPQRVLPEMMRREGSDRWIGAARGDDPLVDDTLLSFEMYLEAAAPQWDDQRVRMATEQIVAFTAGAVHYLGGRQTELHVIA